MPFLIQQDTPVIIDYHIHTPYCGHAHGKTIEYVERAIALGFSEICFSDHLGRYYLTHVQRRRYWDWGMDERAINRYICELEDLQTVFEDRIRIKIGLEIDYIEGADELLAPFLSCYPFDFLLCSIHCLPRFGWKHLADYKDKAGMDVYREYFRYARAAIASGHFHSLAHCDFVWRYLEWPGEGAEDMLDEEIASTVAAAKKHDRCIEINANGYLWSYTHISHGFDPFLALVGECARQEVPVTLGSDAHDPSLIGKTYHDLLPVLRSWGIKEVALFDRGVRTMAPLG